MSLGYPGDHGSTFVHDTSDGGADEEPVVAIMNIWYSLLPLVLPIEPSAVNEEPVHNPARIEPLSMIQADSTSPDATPVMA